MTTIFASRSDGWRKTLGAMTLLVLFALFLLPSAVQAQNKLGGHFGVVLPISTWQGSDTTTLGDHAVVGFPMGITIKKTEQLALDLEVVPVIDSNHINFTVHPGVVYNVWGPYAAGVRMAFDVNQDSWGFTPLVSRRLFFLEDGFPVFAELDVPIRMHKHGDTSVTLALHLGVGF